MKIFKSGPGIGFLDSRYVNVTGDTMTGGLTINTNSTTALLIEQDGVKDNVLVVDTANGRVSSINFVGDGNTPAILGAGLKSPYTHVVVVDAGGKGDYTTIKGACDYVATQSPGSGNSWGIEVNPGIYYEVAFSVPAYTTVYGIGSSCNQDHEIPMINFKNVGSGTCLSLGNRAEISKTSIRWVFSDGGVQTGDLRIVSNTSYGRVSDCYFYIIANDASYDVSGIYCPSQGITVANCNVVTTNIGSGKGYAVHSNGGTLNIQWTALFAEKAAYCQSGTLSLYQSMEYPGSGGIQRDAGTLNVSQSSYLSSTGTITHVDRTIYNNSQATWIAGSASQSPLILKGASSQTANLTEWQNSSGTVLSGIQGRGSFYSNLGTPSTNLFIGKDVANLTMTGTYNVAIGESSLASNTTGFYNFSGGTFSLFSNTEGVRNMAFGYLSQYSNIDGNRNTGVGMGTLAFNQHGDDNLGLGYYALYSATGSGNIGIGNHAGYRQGAVSNLFIIDNQSTPRADAATELTNSILYGIMAALPANQDLYINADLYLKADSRPIYFGGGDDMSIYYDGTNGNIDTDLVAPSDLYIDCGTGKTLMLEVPVWRSHDLAPQRVKLPADNPPAEDTIDGFGFHRYNRGTEESTYFTWTVPQCFATGTANVRGYYVFLVENPPAAETADENVRMGFEYKKISDGDVFDFDAGTSSGYIDETIAQGEDAYKLHYTSNGVCDTTGWEAGDTILFRFYRDATAPEDTYDNEASADDNDVWLKTYHIEYKTNKIGAVS